jgi:hypothetical protein
MAVTDAVKGYLGELTLGKSIIKGALGVTPLHSSEAGKVDYITYDEALKNGSISVTEIDEGGSVPELRLKNKGGQRVLILDGEQLVGAKQNRILNTTVLVEADDTLIIPVTCVEQGRWSYSPGERPADRDMSSSRHNMKARSRRTKAEAVHCNLARDRGYIGDQSQSWHEIHQTMRDLQVDSPTSAMEDVYTAREDELKAFLEALALERFDQSETIVGAVFALGGKILGMDAFSKHSTIAHSWEKLTSSYAIEALRSKAEGEVDLNGVKGFLERIQGTEMNIFPPPGLGKDVRFQSDEVVGSGLVVDDEVIHLNAFNTESQETDEHRTPRSTMSRFGDRRDARRFWE